MKPKRGFRQWARKTFEGVDYKEVFAESWVEYVESSLRPTPRIVNFWKDMLETGSWEGVSSAFSWRKTPQGHAFWYKIGSGSATAEENQEAKRFLRFLIKSFS